MGWYRYWGGVMERSSLALIYSAQRLSFEASVFCGFGVRCQRPPGAMRSLICGGGSAPSDRTRRTVR